MSASIRNVFFDTTILVYTVFGEKEKTDVAERLITDGGFISVQTLNEFTSVVRKKLKMPWPAIALALEDIQALCKPPISLTIATQHSARQIAERYGYQIYDSLIIASALESRCSTLYSEDMQDGQKINSLTIRNPFKSR